MNLDKDQIIFLERIGFIESRNNNGCKRRKIILRNDILVFEI